MGYKALLFLEKLLMALPHSARKKFFSFLAWVAYVVSKKYRNVVRINLDFVFGDTLSEKEKKEITRYSFQNLFFNFLHLMEMRHMTKEDFRKKVSLKNFDIVQNALASQKPVVFITAHYGAWELTGASISAYVQPVTAVYKHLKNREYEEWLIQARGSFGNESVEKTNVLKKLLKVVKRKGAIGILIDTHIPKSEGVVVYFFGKKIPQTPVPAFLARKFDAIIVPAIARTKDDERYEVIFYDPIPLTKTDDVDADIKTITQAQATWLEGVIKEEPKFWFWLHKRFKGFYPEIYKNA